MIGVGFGVVLSALAGYRIGRAVAVDGITDPFRFRLFAAMMRRGEVVPTGEATGARSWRTWLYGLVSCPYCVGFWATAGLYLLWDASSSSSGYHVAVAVLAATGAQALFTAWSRL